MAKLQSSFRNMLLVLTGISLFAAAALASVYSLTKEPIDESKVAKQQSAIEQVLPEFDSLDAPFDVEIDEMQIAVIKAFNANGDFVGAAVESFSNNGFNGQVRVMIGFDKNGEILNYSVLDQKETPGLGTKMLDWFKPQVAAEKSLLEKIFGFEVASVERNSSIVGKNPGKNKLQVAQDGGEIDAITASTISSRAFLEAVQYAYAAYINDPDYKIDTSSGASDVKEATSNEDDKQEKIIADENPENESNAINLDTIAVPDNIFANEKASETITKVLEEKEETQKKTEQTSLTPKAPNTETKPAVKKETDSRTGATKIN